VELARVSHVAVESRASVRVRVLAVAEELVERDADGSNRLPDGINGPS
jgi:hypothetical protein